uniref:Uncharacterized protein n=1 Tax=Oryza sativa subsp. japonica TaxID=39947 RepID=Q67UD4_ORYSJ|nr:hypothetical protein [Oryza sativa Japonica Group]BAD38237.1 hypothetical protein [Oryza sativa Japonica Group]
MNQIRWRRASEDIVVTDRARPFETMDYLYQSFEKWKMQSQRSRIFDSLIIKKGIDQGKGGQETPGLFMPRLPGGSKIEPRAPERASWRLGPNPGDSGPILT